MHDHGEKIHTCKKCLYWHVANGRFEVHTCPNCGDKLGTYSSRDWIIENIDKRFEAIPKDKTMVFGLDGFINKRLVWIDDIRNPLENDWLVFSPISSPYDVFWVKSYYEFVEWVNKNGIPDGICFDHDLADVHMDPNIDWTIPQYFDEKTGKDCANWLVDYCIDNDTDLPLWNIHSGNPVGKDNIKSYLTNYKKFRDENRVEK